MRNAARPCASLPSDPGPGSQRPQGLPGPRCSQPRTPPKWTLVLCGPARALAVLVVRASVSVPQLQPSDPVRPGLSPKLEPRGGGPQPTPRILLPPPHPQDCVLAGRLALCAGAGIPGPSSTPSGHTLPTPTCGAIPKSN